MISLSTVLNHFDSHSDRLLERKRYHQNNRLNIYAYVLIIPEFITYALLLPLPSRRFGNFLTVRNGNEAFARPFRTTSLAITTIFMVRVAVFMNESKIVHFYESERLYEI